MNGRLELALARQLAGDVKFTIENQGTIPHEFIIVKTDFALGEDSVGP
jgi:hypothetical protein